MDFTKQLIKWYLQNKRDLPWRKTNNPYHIWLSEIILQQTRIEQGLPYYLKFITAYPTVFDLAHASEENILKLWQGLGYYSRARNLHFTAKVIAHEMNGEFPTTFEELKKLKGIGDYTASAIASFCFNETQPVVDGNVYRILSRYFGIDTPINQSNSLKTFKELAFELIDKKQPATFNQALMEFGSRQCKPRNPDCTNCVYNTSCVAFKDKTVDTLPIKLKKIKIKQRYFNYLVVISDDKKTILDQRIGKGIWQNLYQFPLIETKNIAEEKILLEDSFFSECTNFSISKYNAEPIKHKLSHQHIYTTYWIVTTPKIKKNSIKINRLRDFPVPILIHNFIEAFKF